MASELTFKEAIITLLTSDTTGVSGVKLDHDCFESHLSSVMRLIGNKIRAAKSDRTISTGHIQSLREIYKIIWAYDKADAKKQMEKKQEFEMTARNRDLYFAVNDVTASVVTDEMAAEFANQLRI